jgi:ABC-2 type transport system ATP-binding protein
MPPAIELRRVGKRYQKLEQQPTLLRTLLPFRREAGRELWALRDIDLEVAQGEIIGVLGQNGAGKTTMLRLLAGVTRPTTGRIRVHGRIGPLIGLGVGFHDEMSGRENVLVNGMLLGLTSKEVHARFDLIVEFAELEKFIDTPVKFYSSGMYMRLGFAVIAHTDPTILLVDEILAVGDLRFQVKCLDRLRTLRQKGATVMMVSHSTYMVRQLCERAVVIKEGKLAYDGEIEPAITLHQRLAAGALHLGDNAPVEFTDCCFVDGARDWRHVAYDELVELRAQLMFHQRVEDPVITVSVITNIGLLAGFNTTPGGRSWRTFDRGREATVRVTFLARLGGGTYRLIVELKDGASDESLARSDDLILTVAEREGSSGVADVCAQIELSERYAPELKQT